tara:strand:+ start:110 stop:1063 length:954 start_codon:yes stop_codon:yes gene_type:complete
MVESEKAGVIGGCCFILLLISGGLVGCSFSTLDYNHVGLDFDSTSQKLNEDKLFYNGRHFIGLAHSFISYPTYLHTIEFADGGGGEGPTSASSAPLNAGSKDGQAITIELSFFMRINTTLSNVLTLYQEYKTSYMPTVVSRAQDAVKSTTVLFETLEFFTNRSDISEAIHQALSETLAPLSMTVVSVQLRNIQLSTNFEDAIIDKIVSAQADKTATEMGLAQQVQADTGVFAQAADSEIAVLTADASSTAVVTTGTASADATKRRIEADAAALSLLKQDLLSNNAQMLQYLWSQTLRDDTNSKLLVGLQNNPAIVTA